MHSLSGKQTNSGGASPNITGGPKASQQRQKVKKPDAPAKPLTPVEILSKELLPLGQFTHARNPEQAKRVDVTDTLSFLANNTALAIGNTTASLQPGEKIALSWALSVHEGHPLLGDGSKPVEGAQLVDPAVLQSFLIQERNIPQSYWDAQKRIYREQGYGDMELTQEMINGHVAMLQGEQKASLLQWIEYLRESDYPLWYQILVIHSVLDLGSFQEGGEGGKFPRRTSSSVSPYPELDRESLALLFTALSRQATGEEVGDLPFEITPEVQDLLKNGNWSRLYERSVVHKKRTFLTRDKDVTDGVWITYERSDKFEDAQRLADSLAGYATGWCTAGAETAHQQLSGGNFYIYCTKDTNGEYCVPRSAVRMNGDSVGEIRGVAKAQNLEQGMEDVVTDFAKDLPGNEAYLRKTADMRLVGELEERVKNGDRHLDPASRLFLTGVTGRVEGFGFTDDPRIEEILDQLEDFDSTQDLLQYFEDNNYQLPRSLRLDIYPAIESLPDGLSVAGELLFGPGHKITSLPAGLRVGTSLFVNGDIAAIPADVHVGEHLYLRGAVAELSEGLVVGKNLYMETPIAHLPEDMRVGGDLSLPHVFPDNVFCESIAVGGQIRYGGSVVTEAPDGRIIANGNIGLRYSKTAVLPRNLQVNGDLDISNSAIIQLPEHLDVNGALNISKTEITHLPEDMHVTMLDIRDTEIIELPDELQVDGNLLMTNIPSSLSKPGVHVGGKIYLRNETVMTAEDNITVHGNFLCKQEKLLCENLHVTGDMLVTEQLERLPPGLRVDGDFNICGTKINQLPYVEIGGGLTIGADTALPEGLRINKHLMIGANLTGDPVVPLPENLHVGADLWVTEDSGITTLPKGLRVAEELTISRCATLTTLPDDLDVGHLIIAESGITELPANLRIPGNVRLTNTKIRKLPNGLQVGGNLTLDDTCVEEIPSGLQVEGTLEIPATVKMPDGLRVGQDLVLIPDGNSVPELPKNLWVGGDLDMSRLSPDTKIPEGLYVGGKLTLAKE